MAGNRTALVTGTSSGIGAAVVDRLARSGWTVLAGVRTPADAERLDRSHPAVHSALLDVTVPEQIAACAELVAEHAPGGLAGLVDNAGVARGGPLEYLDLDELREQFEVNVIGQLAVVQALLPHLRAAGGRVVMVGSIAGRIAAPNMGPYSASKAALAALSESLRAELAPWRLPVVLIEPGAVASEIWDKGAETAARIRASLPEHARRDYGPLLDHTDRVIDQSRRHAEPADRVAVVVERALTARRPRPIYVVGRDARIAAALLRALPARARAALVRRL